jgi:hypothetical protein
MNKRETMKDMPECGRVILLYGETGVGKTTSLLSTAPQGSLYIPTEPRNPRISMEAAKRPLDDIFVYRYTDWLSLMSFLLEDDMKQYADKAIILDSATHLMNVRLSNEIEDEVFDAKDDKEKEIKAIINSSKLSMEGYGGLSSQMSRLIKVLGDFTRQGTDIIITALVTEHPKWDRELSAAPALKGKEFPMNLPGFCDLIGYVVPRIDPKDNKKKFPPIVQFEARNGEYMSKFTGVRPDVDIVRVPLDLNIILKKGKKTVV